MEQYDVGGQFKSLCVCGDIHGEFMTLIFNLKRLNIKNSVVIVAGDCGIGFEENPYYSMLYDKLRKPLCEDNNLLLLMRGNHDDPAYFDGEKIDFKRMKCIPDYSVVKFGSANILCIGGAVSVDRSGRKQTMRMQEIKKQRVRPLYWENEIAEYNETELSDIENRNVKIDTVITHSCPSFCYPLTKSGISDWLLQDKTLADDLKIERQNLDRVFDRLIREGHPLKNWFYGHFHTSRQEFIDNINFCLLGIMETKEAITLNQEQ